MKKTFASGTMLTLAALSFPLISFAETKTLATVITLIIRYLNMALFLLMAFAVVMFVWYVIKYFILPNENRKEAGMYVLYSVIGFFVILSFWGLVNILNNTFGLDNQDNRYQTWNSFTNIFPQSSSNSSGSPLTGNQPSNNSVFNGVSTPPASSVTNGADPNIGWDEQ